MGRLRRGGDQAWASWRVCSSHFGVSSPPRSLIPTAQWVSDLTRKCFLPSDTFSAEEGVGQGVGGSSPASVPETRGSDGPGGHAWKPSV